MELLLNSPMAAGLNIWDSLHRLVLWLLFVAAVVAVVLWYVPVIRRNEGLRREIYEVDRRIEKERENSRQLDAKLKSLNDPKTIERLARERLSYAKPGEVIFHFETPQAAR